MRLTISSGSGDGRVAGGGGSPGRGLGQLSVGDRVQIGHDVRPAYLHGLPATVIRRGTGTITIRLDRPVGKFADGCIRCSPLAVEKLDT